MDRKNRSFVPLKNVRVEGAFWEPRQETNREVTLPIEYQQCKTTGRIDAWKLDWKPGEPGRPHHFWDSDVAKWIEAAAYSLGLHPDEELEARVDEVIGLMAEAQLEDGYLNIYYNVVEPGKRWTNLKDMHELYCAGHLMEAAVAYYEATGKRKLLDVMCRYADHIDSVFGHGEHKKQGYPGHEEIELALIKLYRVTGEERYLRLSQYFIDERGKQPHYFNKEAKERGEDLEEANQWRSWEVGQHTYYQAHLPVREQDTAEGHSVRAMYLYSGMADVAMETGDQTLMAACRKLWDNVVLKRMYITGGIGSSSHGERFTFDHHLPNETAYAETCAAIGLVFWAHRMLQMDGHGKYADIMEKALYNGVLSGISLDGTKFFYANPLEVYPAAYEEQGLDLGGAVAPVRQEWFGCACCPPNIARLLASLGQYIYSQSQNGISVDLYIQSQATIDLSGEKIVLSQRTEYPWDEKITIDILPEKQSKFTLALRIPEWCRGFKVKVNDAYVEDVQDKIHKGYFRLERNWEPGDQVELELQMPIERMEAHPAVRENAGRIALQRGPIVYCLEEVDNGPNLANIVIPREEELKAELKPDLLGGVTIIRGKAWRRSSAGWGDTLYRPIAEGKTDREECNITAVPYFAWCNREPGEMLVWIRSE